MSRVSSTPVAPLSERRRALVSPPPNLLLHQAPPSDRPRLQDLPLQANDFCDRFATIGFNANLITYLTQQLHLPLVEASNTLTNFHGFSNLTPVIGGLIADSFAGRFWTIAAGSVIYQLGMVSLTVSALLPSLRPPPCAAMAGAEQACARASAWTLLVLHLSLLCTSIGTGGTRPCIMAFGADQFEPDRPCHGEAGKKQRWSFFNLYFFGIELAKLAAITLVVYIQENVGWGWGLGVPTIAMLVAVTAFMSGYSLYVKMAPGGSPFTRLAQVAVAAFQKRNVTVPSDPRLLYQDKKLDAGISTAGRLLHTNQFTFFDRAAIVTPGDLTSSGAPQPWRLSTVHRVEELKSIIRMLPIWGAGILLVTSASHNHSFAIQQARTMDRRITAHLEIPPASMLIFSNIAMLGTLALYDLVLVPRLRRLTGQPAGITHLQRTGIGLTISMLSNIVSAVVEGWRKRAAARHGLLDSPGATVPMSVFWMAPQYAIHGVADAFMDVGRMEFLYDQAPESMRSSAAALYWLTMSAGSYMGTLLVTTVHERTKGEGEWLQDNLNRGRLDLYYWLVVTLQVINVVYFVVCAKLYTYKKLEVVDQEESADEREEKGSKEKHVELQPPKDSDGKDVELRPLLSSDL
ncbi:Protein NRT1/ PTR FAMILY 3.1 [Dichanthelium oligosanthes]|uniref:Protein NRT1/ PTR FAMILY 3.1 n=1 Tax=Dichanthelium oligosanthes TaxID=888268 RepID=A0A1E5WG66_9POAL|nr:Protein NRT1/ PTR FAMILY 3.1 [Dichanthelium oligosanthes]